MDGSDVTRVKAWIACCVLLVACSPAPSREAANAERRASQVQASNALSRTRAEPTSPAIASATDESLSDFAKRIGVDCDRDRSPMQCMGGKPENGDIYDVELMPSCGGDGFFGGVAARDGAELRDALPPKDESTPAILPKGQLVCIQAIARAGQQPEYFYVSTLHASAVAACKGNPLCEAYGDRPIETLASATPCPVTGDAACAAGWIDADAIEAFENGM